MAGKLELYLFGPPEVRLDGRPLTGFRTAKAEALLYYLAATGQAHTRLALAGLLWGQWSDSRALVSLSKALSNLRQLVGEHLEISRESVAFNRQSDIWLDLETMRSLWESPRAGPDISTLPHIGRFRGDFLEGFSVHDAPEFEEWLLRERAQWRQRAAQALHTLADHHITCGQPDDAISLLQQVLALEPWREETHRQVMRLLARTGQRSAALAQYASCRQALAEALAVEPSPETETLYRHIRQGEIDTEAPPVVARDEPSTPSTSATPPHNLPAQLTPFVGRVEEAARIVAHLRDPTCRLLTLVGPGGIGKTRLALKAAQQLIDQSTETNPFADGVFFVSLAPVAAPANLASAIADAVGFQFFGHVPLRQQLLDYLRTKQMLLVLDNFEHLLAGVDLISDILGAASGVTILVTSREALQLYEEWFHPVTGLAVPQPEAVALDVLAGVDAVQLFVQRGQRARPGFSLAVEQDHVVHICRLVEGMPLALELAAAWLKVLPPARVAAEVERNLDILTAQYRDLPERHQSMRVVLEQTWAMLDQEEQRVFRRLSVFRGGFHIEAAEQIAGASLPLLALLAEKALVRVTTGGRYQLHELIRQFAAEQAHSSQDEQEQAQARHCAYYLSLLQQQTPNMKGKRHQEAFAEIAAELDNVRAAWQYAALHKDIQALDSAAEGLWVFSDSRGTFLEGETAFQQAYDALTDPPAATDLPKAHLALIGFLRAGQGYLYNRRGYVQEGRAYLEQAIALLRQVEPQARRKMAFALLYLGWIHGTNFLVEEAKRLGQESMALFTQVNDPWGIVACMELLGVVAKNSGQLAEAEQLLQEGLAMSTKIEAQKLRGGFLHNLGSIAAWLGEYDRAQQYLDEALYNSHIIGTLPGIINVERDVARLAIAQGNYDHVIQLLEAELRRLQQTRQRWQPRLLPFLGEAYRLFGDDAQAERRFQECLQIARADGNRVATAHALNGLGILYLERGETSRAEQLQREALALWRQHGSEIESAVVCCHLGHVLAASGEKRGLEAEQIYRETLQVALKHRLAPIALDVFVGLARRLAAKGAFYRADELLALAARHRASTAETRGRAGALQSELSARMAMMSATAAHSAGLMLDWQDMARRLLEDLPLADSSARE
jgi:predicted ATPase/DNA-binding SARP family transcriptional activator